MTYTPTEAGISEGVYTEWAKKWAIAKDVPDGSISDSYYTAFFIDDKNDLIYLGWKDATSPFKRRYGIYNISDFSMVFQSPSDAHYAYIYGNMIYGFGFGMAAMADVGASRSLQTYVFLLRSDRHTIEIWRNGVKIWTHDMRTEVAGDTVYYGEISITGKYIFILTNTNHKYILYEGS